MSAVLEQRLIDQSAGYELVTGDEISLEATRHLFIAACLLDPARKRDIQLERGGEELDNKCLRRTNGLLPRCAITPLEFWGQQLPLDLFPEGVRPLKLKGNESTAFPQPQGLVAGLNPQLFKSDLYFLPLYPGELIVDAIGISSGERRGVVEVEALRGVDYGGADREMDALFFPEGWVVPKQLRLVREQIERVAGSVVDPDVQSIANNFVRSIEESTEYMTERIGLETTQNQMRVHPAGHIYRFSPKVRWFAEQLEIKLTDVNGQITQQAQQVVQSIDPAVLNQLNAESITQIGEAIAGALAKVLNGPPAEPATEAAKPKSSK